MLQPMMKLSISRQKPTTIIIFHPVKGQWLGLVLGIQVEGIPQPPASRTSLSTNYIHPQNGYLLDSQGGHKRAKQV